MHKKVNIKTARKGRENHPGYNKNDEWNNAGQSRSGHNFQTKNLTKSLEFPLKKQGFGTSEKCPFGAAAMTSQHILQERMRHDTLRQAIWPVSQSMERKLNGDIIKSLFKPKQPRDSHHLPRKEQFIILRLRTDHNRLNSHIHRAMKKVPSPLCPCWEADQNTAHILQDCVLHHQQRKDIWPGATSLQVKLHGPVEQLYRTARFLTCSGLWVW